MSSTSTDDGPSDRKKPRLAEGDWVCFDPQCANVNFKGRTSCNKCGKVVMDDATRKKMLGIAIGKQAAEKSKGLFSADDWQCPKCGNVNWARRQQCNVCNAPKFGDEEKRTGYGGGYNDRGVVEYIEREASDDEYDEFGRKKKKFRKAEPNDNDKKESDEKPKVEESDEESGSSESEEEKKGSDNEEEEEDDDDEDCDLSKYDLSGWGDDDDEESKKDDKKEDK